ncbi:MAG: tetratricopeptide repeat protein [Kofleriaceae bacterium]|nr:tetratricopeptide repeat protein [Kofleriaceae bacterium]
MAKPAPIDLDDATATVKQAPHAVSAWDDLESAAAAKDKPDVVVATYRQVLTGQVTAEVAEMIGQRACAFCDEWFGDDPKVLEGLLRRVLELAPNSESALQRLSVLFTDGERWNELLGAYDRALEASRDKTRRIRLLREASQLSKDVANQPDKAIGYMQRLLPLTPDDHQLSIGLERLLERHERWADLIALWEGRLEGQSRKEREKSRGRIAAVWLDNLRDPGRALAAAKPLLSEAEDDAEATGLLERIIESRDASRQVRDAALDLLRAHYDSTARPREVIRVLERVIAIDPAGSRALREETGARLAELDDDKAAMDHYAALLALQPESSVTQEKLRQLAQRATNWAGYADGVASAGRNAASVARRVELLAEAARTRLDLLDDPSGAVDLYQEALAQDGAGEREQLMVSRRLSELYSRVDRPRERLDLLERLAVLEQGDAAQRGVLGTAARLAESLGEPARALALWQRRIDADPTDLPALDARIVLLETVQRWDDLITTLELRANLTPSPAQKRTDLIKIAGIHRDHRADLGSAITAWQTVARESGEDAESVSALADLLAETGRWREMADLLERASGRDTERTVSRLGRLGDAQLQHLDAPAQALAAYQSALAIDADDAVARAGLRTLLALPATRAAAADALAEAFRRCREWNAVLELMPARLAEAGDDRTRLALLREAAGLRAQQDDAKGALADLVAAFPLAPRDAMIEDQLRALAERTGDWTSAALAYDGAVTALAGAPVEAARLRIAYADILRDRLGDRDTALSTYLAAAATVPGELRAVGPIASLAATAGRWEDAARVVIAYFASRERVDEELLSGIDQAAIAAGAAALDRWTTALAAATDAANLPATGKATVAARLAALHRDHRKDTQSTIAALRRALELGGERLSWLHDLATQERAAAANRQLLSTLQRIGDADARDLDALVEAADVASKLGDREQALAMLGRVLSRAGAAWRGNTAIKSSRPAEAVTRWAVDGLVDLHRMSGHPRAAIEVLVEAARLPFDEDARRTLRLRGADIATVDLRDNAAAIDMYRAALAAAPTDLEIMDRLGRALEAEDRVPEQLSLRQAQLGLERDGERKLGLRLEIARLVGLVEVRGGRLEALRANLDERPGHEASIDAVAHLLTDKGQHRALCELLEEQAGRLEAAADGARAARLFGKSAQVAEVDLEDVDRAISCHRRVVGLAPTTESLSALARLNLGRGQPAQAVPWLESLVGAASGTDKMALVEQLARAHLGAHQPDRAITAIEANLDDRQPAIPLRQLLSELYRAAGQWEPLARHLTRSLTLLRDDKLAGDFAREAAAIYADRLDQPGKAVPALETALALDPSNKDLRGRLAEGLRVAGRLGEARAILAELIADFGRRRSPERAGLHVRLARVAQAEGKLDEALAEMEQASKMDVGNAQIQRELAEMARVGGQIDKAERTYRALLLAVRRQPPGEDEAAVGAAEVLYELHRIVTARGEDDQSKELLESAIDAATQSDAEVRRLRRSLVAHGDQALLLKVLDLRLAQSPEAVSQAKLLADKADVLSSQGRGGDALDAMMKALQAVPGRLGLHEKARVLAREVGQTRRYVDAVEGLVDRLRRKDDPPLVADILMRAGQALEDDAGDPKGAAAMYQRVEMLGERLAEAFYAQARVAGLLGDTDEQARALDKMLTLAGTGDASTPAQIDALYRLAEIFIATPKRRTQGVELLERAFASEPRWAQAGRILRVAAVEQADDPRVMALFERVARNGGDAMLLLDFLELRARRSDVTQAQIREGVNIGIDVGAHARVEVLLQRAIEVAKTSADGPTAATWATLGLADRRLAAGDLTGAKDLMYEIAMIAEGGDIDALAARIAARAGAERPTMELAAEVYEFLRERHPSDRAVWEPLLGLYRELGDGDRLSSVVSSTLPGLEQASERNALRLQHARFLIERLRRHHDAMDVLRDALADDPDDLTAASLLEQTLRELGDDEGMTEFLWNRFEDAQRRGNRASTVDVALRLGGMLDAAGSADAGRVYRAAMTVAPDDRDILRQVVAHVGPDDDARETALLMERLLAVETPDRVPALCGQLASAWQQAGDAAGVQRTLELAHRAAPDDVAIHDRLEGWYREREQWAELATLMCADAERASGAAAVARLREAAGVYSGFLGQPLRAATVLRGALERAPTSGTLVTELAAALAAGGEVDEAQAAIGAAIGGITGAERVNLLLMRASLRQQLGDDLGAVDDLREAYGLDAERAVSAYADGLDRLRERSQSTGDEDGERTATLRQAELLTTHGELERARAMLVGWIERAPRDAEPLYMLCAMDTSIEHWPGVVAAATRLAYITEGQAQVDAAMRTADAATRAGNPADGVPVLEVVHGQQPEVGVIRDRLREAYEAAGQFRELAGILFADAEHGTDVEVRFTTYRRAAELYLYQAGDAAAAAPATAAALGLKPDDHGAMMMHIDILLGLGQVDDAARTLEESINAQKKRTPELAVLQQRMARVAAMQGDRDGQVGWLKKAFDVDRKNAEVAAELAQVATEMGDYELALKPLRAITLMDNPAPVTRPMALLWEAKIEHARGNRAKAELWAKKALREDPTFAEAQTFLDELGG